MQNKGGINETLDKVQLGSAKCINIFLCPPLLLVKKCLLLLTHDEKKEDQVPSQSTSNDVNSASPPDDITNVELKVSQGAKEDMIGKSDKGLEDEKKMVTDEAEG